MSVCYILPEMMANMKKIQMAQRARGINQQKTILEKIKSILPVLVPLVIKTLDQSMERSIALRLRGFNSPHRVALKSANLYRHEMVNHRGLSLLAIILIEWKLWIIGSKFILENLSLRYRGIETSALKHISVDAEFGHVIGIIGNHHAGKNIVMSGISRNCTNNYFR